MGLGFLELGHGGEEKWLDFPVLGLERRVAADMRGCVRRKMGEMGRWGRVLCLSKEVEKYIPAPLLF